MDDVYIGAMAKALEQWTVGEFLFDRATGELRREGATTRLRPQAAQVLALLAERAGEMVSRERLQRALWPDATVDYDLSLNVCIRQIRVALGDDAEAPTYIETLPRRGYRLLADVTLTGGEKERRAHRRWLLVGGAVAAVAAVTAALLALRPAPPSSIASLAVLPLRSIPNDPGLEYLEDGLTEELITALAGLDPDRLAVIARTSSAALATEGRDTLAVGAQLDARYVLEGGLRRVGSEFRVTVRLLDTRSAAYTWADSYDLSADEVLHLEGRVAQPLAEALAEELEIAPRTPLVEDVLVGEERPHPQAREALLRARYLLDKLTPQDAERAVVLLREAMPIDPDYVDLHTALARAHLQLDELDAAEAALDRARAIDGEASGIEAIAGAVALYGRGDPWQAVEHLEVAVSRRPGVAVALRSYANALAAAGRVEEALEPGYRAIELDPVSASVKGDVGWIFYYAARFGEARRICRSSLELFPGSTSALECVLLSSALSGALAQEMDLVAQLLSLLGASPSEQAGLLAAVEEGREDELWRWLLDDSGRVAAVGQINQARLLALLGEHPRAARTVEELSRATPRALLFVPVDPVFEKTRAEPRFSAAVHRAGLGRALDSRRALPLALFGASGLVFGLASHQARQHLFAPPPQL